MVTSPEHKSIPDFDLTAQAAVMDALVEAIVITDSQGQIERLNKAAIKMFGYTAEEAVGKGVSMLMTGADGEQHPRHVDRYLRTREAHIIGCLFIHI